MLPWGAVPVPGRPRELPCPEQLGRVPGGGASLLADRSRRCPRCLGRPPRRRRPARRNPCVVRRRTAAILRPLAARRRGPRAPHLPGARLASAAGLERHASPAVGRPPPGG